MTNRLIPDIGKRVNLADWDPRGDCDLVADKGEAKAEIVQLRQRLSDLQDTLYADRRFAVLVVLQGMDTSGKDSTIRSVFEQVGPLGSRVENFGVPGDDELARDFLWRYHLRTPRRGTITIFNRSHYEGVLVERVKNIVPPSVWRSRYDQINRFEEMLASEDTIILKFFLYISKEEQRERLQERVDNPRKRWKLTPGDISDRALWDEYCLAYEDAITRCNTVVAPWHIVPADRKWYRDVVVARAVIDRLESLGLRHPEGDDSLAGTIVE